MLIWNFFQIFSIMFVTQNIRAQSLPNYKDFDACYSYFILQKASRVSISTPIYRLIVDALLQLFIKKDLACTQSNHSIHVTQRVSENLNYLAFTPIYMKNSWPGGISMVEKPPLYIYDIYLEVEAHGGHGGIWRPFYLSEVYNTCSSAIFIRNSMAPFSFAVSMQCWSCLE